MGKKDNSLSCSSIYSLFLPTQLIYALIQKSGQIVLSLIYRQLSPSGKYVKRCILQRPRVHILAVINGLIGSMLTYIHVVLLKKHHMKARKRMVSFAPYVVPDTISLIVPPFSGV